VSSPASIPIFSLVLAAGSASRFGSTKQIARLDGAPLVQSAMQAANLACGDRCVLVTGYDWRAVIRACEPIRGFMVRNDRFAAGLGTSIGLAVRNVRHVATAVVVMLADQPRVSAEHLQALIAAWSRADSEIVATGYSGSAGAPVLFPAACFADLAGLDGDTGGKHLLEDPRFALRTVDFEPAAIDIDTPEDLRRLQPHGVP
jgi:molybdenum cofactor cytidylyltransferase